MGEKINITFGGSNCVLPSKPEVVYEGYIVIKRGLRTVGRIDATFDFSKLHPSLHWLALSAIQSGSIAIHDCVTDRPRKLESPYKKQEPKPTLWRRLWKKLKP